MSTGRALQVGDYALTDFNGRGMTRVMITARDIHSQSQSGTRYRVTPPLRGCEPDAWFDADWFEQEPQPAAKEGTCQR